MCEHFKSACTMTRLLFWGVLALLLHTGLLLIPVYDTSAVVSSGQGVSVRIQNTTLKNSAGQIINHEPGKSPALQEPVSAENHENVLTQAVKPNAETSKPNVETLKQSKPQLQHLAPVKAVNPSEKIVALNQKTMVKTSQSSKPASAIETVAVKTTENPEVQPSSLNVASDHKKSDRNESAAVATKPRLISARPASSKKPKYPRRAIVRNQQGSVRVELLIKQDGFVEEATLLESSGFPLLDKSVLKYVNEERFIAALDKGLPVASTQLFTYRFVLQ